MIKGFLTKLSLSHPVPPEMDLDASVKEKIVVHAGGTIRIIAYVSGKPAPQITWCRDDGEVPKEAAVEKTGISNSLVIKNCRRQHQGIYTLSAKNEGGERKKAVIVEVLGESACLRCIRLLLVNMKPLM